MAVWTLEQVTYIIAFLHPEKMLAGTPGVNDLPLHVAFGVDKATYDSIRRGFEQRTRGAAQELLADPTFAQRVERLPFAPGDKVVGFGDSITDDYQSWLEILRHLLALRRPHDGIVVINAGYSGDTTSQMLSRFLPVVQEKPDWIICLAGTNDARAHGRQPAKTMVSIEETALNLTALRHFAATETTARWVWLTPTPVIESKIPAHWWLGTGEMAWSNRDLSAIAAVVRRQRDAVVDLQAAFGNPANPDLLLPDGLHPSLAGQMVIVRALVERLTIVQYYVYENWQAQGHRATIHVSGCSFCNDRQGIHPGATTEHGQWHGPFVGLQAAQDAAVKTGARVRECGHCRDLDTR